MSKVKLIASVGVEVRPVTDGFRRDVKRGVERELAGYNPEVKVHGDVEFDRGQVKREADKARRWAEEHNAEILAKLKLDQSAARDLDDLSKRFGDLDKRIKDTEKSSDGMRHAMDMSDAHRNLIKMREELDRVSSTNKRIRDELRQADLSTAESTSKAIDAARRRLNGQDWGKTAELRMQFSSENARREAERARREIENKLDGIKAKIKAEPVGLALAAAQMKIASRDRQVNFFVRVNAASLATAEGLLRSLAGLNVLSKTGDILQNLLKNFDTMALKGASWVAAGGSIADSMGWLAQAALGLGGSLAKMGGFAVLAPTALAGLASTMLVTSAVFTDFGKAVGGDAKALEALPAAGRKAATQMATVWKDLREGISTEFWGGASKGMLDFTEKALPAFSAGIQKFSGSFGKSFGKVLDSFTAAGVEGKLTRMFDNLARGIDNMTPGVTALWNGINEVGLQGSQWLPRIGTYLSNNFKRFESWVDLNSKNGNMFVWVENAATSFGQLWRSMGNTIDIFRGLTRAAEEGGAQGLAGFESTTRRIADLFMGEPFQSRMVQIFAGANQGARALGEGAKIMATSLGESAGWLSQVLTLAGQLGGSALTNIGAALRNTNFQAGTLDGLREIRQALDRLTPGFAHFGSIVGGAMRVAGGAVKGVAPVINGLLSLVDSGVSRTSQNLAKLAEPLGDFIANRIALLQPFVDGAFDGVNSLLGAFNQLNPALQQGVIAAGAFVLFRSQLADMFIRMDGTKYLSGLKDRWAENAAAARLAGEEVKRFSLSGAILSDVRGRVASLGETFRTLRDQAQLDGLSRSMASLRTAGGMAFGGLRAAASSLVGFLGGPWGIAFMAAGALVSVFAQRQADARARVEALSGSLDSQGKVTKASMDKIFESWTNLDEKDNPFDNIFRGAKSANETAKELGLNFGEVTQKIANGGRGYDELVGKLNRMRDAMREGGAVSIEAGKLSSDALRNIAEKAGVSEDAIRNLSAADLNQLIGSITGASSELDSARAKFKGLGDDVNGLSAGARLLEAPMATIRDLTADATSKVQALDQALSILKGNGSKSAHEAAVEHGKVMSEVIKNAQMMHDTFVEQGKSLFKDGLLNPTNEAARAMDADISAIAQRTKESTQRAVDDAVRGHKSIAEIQKIVSAGMSDGEKDLRSYASAAGVEFDKIKGTFDDKFRGANALELTITMTGNADKYRAVLDKAEADGLAFSAQDFMAYLSANPDEANASLEGVTDRFLTWQNGEYKAKLGALDDSAKATLMGLVGMTQDQWNKGDFTAIMKAAKDSPSFAKVLAALLEIKGGDYTAIMKSLTDKGMLGKAEAELNSTARNRPTSISASANTSYAGWTLQNFVDTPRGTTVRVGANTAEANAAVGSFIGWASAQVISIGIRAFGKNADGGLYDSVGGQAGTVRRFMAGGITGMEDHSAKIYAPSSTYRVFAEPETGGEAYIPMAASKRNRSTTILSEVASRFGYELTKTRAFGDGAVVGGNSGALRRGGDLTVRIDQLTQHTGDTVDDLGRAIMRQARREGLVGFTDGI